MCDHFPPDPSEIPHFLGSQWREYNAPPPPVSVSPIPSPTNSLTRNTQPPGAPQPSNQNTQNNHNSPELTRKLSDASSLSTNGTVTKPERPPDKPPIAGKPPKGEKPIVSWKPVPADKPPVTDKPTKPEKPIVPVPSPTKERPGSGRDSIDGTGLSPNPPSPNSKPKSAAIQRPTMLPPPPPPTASEKKDGINTQSSFDTDLWQGQATI